MTDLDLVRQRVGYKVALQGNLDPAVLLAPDSVIQNEVNKVMTSFYGKQKDDTGFVFNLGHGISKETNPDSVSVLIEAVHRF